MTSRWRGKLRPRPGYQRHHILPLALLGRPQMAKLFGQLAEHGLRFDDFSRNGLLLPSSSREAERSGLALHRGPHPGYNAIVLARVERIRVSMAASLAIAPFRAALDAIARLGWLERALRRTLDGAALDLAQPSRPDAAPRRLRRPRPDDRRSVSRLKSDLGV